jgi:PEGA domain
MRLIKLSFFLLQLIILTINSQIIHAAAISPPIPPSPATALFLINNAGAKYDQFIPTIKDNLTSLLTQKGFAIVRTENAILPAGLPDSNENKISNPETEASINRLAETLNARLLVVATINAVTHDESTFDGTKYDAINHKSISNTAIHDENTFDGTVIKQTEIKAETHDVKAFPGTDTAYNVVKTTATDTVRFNLQIYDLGSTKSIYGDSVNTSLRTPVYGQAHTNTILINLFYAAAEKLANNVEVHVANVNASATEPTNSKVTFTVSTNIPSVDVFIDGMVIGSTGKETEFQATPGIHQLKLGKEFIKSWEKTVNIINDAKYSVTLELSAEGLARFQSIQKFNLALKAGEASIDVVKEQSKAQATALVEEAKAKKNNPVKNDGLADNLKK